MITLFHLLELTCGGCGLVIGAQLGFRYYGILGCIAGGVLGGMGGYLIGRIPSAITGWSLDFSLRHRPTEIVAGRPN